MRPVSLLSIGACALLLASAACTASPPPEPLLAPTAAPPTAVPPTAVPTLAPTAVPIVGPALAPTVAVADRKAPDAPGADAVRKIVEAMVASTSYQILGTFTDDNGGVTQVSWEIVKPDKAHVKVSEKSGQIIEMTTIARDVYLNLGGRWSKQTMEAASTYQQGLGFSRLNAEDLVNGFNEAVQKGDKYSAGGMDVVDGTPCREWTFTPSNSKRPSGAWCVGVLDNLPRRFVASETDRLGKMTMIFSSWNQPLKIEAPTF